MRHSKTPLPTSATPVIDKVLTSIAYSMIIGLAAFAVIALAWLVVDQTLRAIGAN